MQYRYIILGVFTCALVVFLSLSEHTAPTEFIPYLDKLIHFVGYGLLTLCSFILFSDKKMKLLAITALILLAMGTEGVQYFMPERTASWQDLAANFTGIFAGALLGVLLRWLYRHFKSPQELALLVFNYLRKL